jgi:predicted nucleotidyltransferase
MDKDDILAKLRAHEKDLRAAGVLGLSLVGSMARGDNQAGSDVDILVRLSPDDSQRGFHYFGRIEALAQRLEAIVGKSVDVIAEPVRKTGLRRIIEKDRIVAF